MCRGPPTAPWRVDLGVRAARSGPGSIGIGPTGRSRLPRCGLAFGGRSSQQPEGGPSMEGPQQIRPKSDADYLEVMTKAAFQSGISWKVIEAKWAGFREAFRGFDPEWVAALTPRDVDRLAQDTRIVRNRRKIEGTVHNAETMVELSREHGSFRCYLRSHGDFEDTVADLKRRFKFLRDLG